MHSPSASTSLIMSCSSASVGFWPSERMTVPSSLVVMVPSPSLSNNENASLNSVEMREITHMSWEPFTYTQPTTGYSAIETDTGVSRSRLDTMSLAPIATLKASHILTTSPAVLYTKHSCNHQHVSPGVFTPQHKGFGDDPLRLNTMQWVLKTHFRVVQKFSPGYFRVNKVTQQTGTAMNDHLQHNTTRYGPHMQTFIR